MLERAIEGVIYGSGWLMAPFYLGLIWVLGALMIKFLQEIYHFVPLTLQMGDIDLILLTLSLLDLTLAASLVLMMILSGYENFVSKLDTGNEARPAWMGTLDFSGLKLKLIASIVAISGIDLLKSFMNVSATSKEDLMWKVITHMAFVVSGVLLALMDYVTERAKKVHHGS
jgi:uncharacterized protein (TIGR00645 family)